MKPEHISQHLELLQTANEPRYAVPNDQDKYRPVLTLTELPKKDSLLAFSLPLFALLLRFFWL